jgi:hypothetical protein
LFDQTGLTKLHWKDVCKLELYHYCYTCCLQDLEEELCGVPSSTLGKVLSWIKYKAEGFYAPYLTSFDIQKRYAPLPLILIDVG